MSRHNEQRDLDDILRAYLHTVFAKSKNELVRFEQVRHLTEHQMHVWRREGVEE